MRAVCYHHATPVQETAIPSSFADNVRRVVPRIPVGNVLDYKTVAGLAGSPKAYLAVGQAMGPPGETFGWHRVVNKKGKLTSPEPDMQYELLIQDGVRFKRDSVVDMAACLWDCDGVKSSM